MLVFNPKDRWTTQSLLQDEYFDDVREKDLEKESKMKVCLSHLDKPGMYDYENHENHSLSLTEITQLIDQEITKFKVIQ